MNIADERLLCTWSLNQLGSTHKKGRNIVNANRKEQFKSRKRGQLLLMQQLRTIQRRTMSVMFWSRKAQSGEKSICSVNTHYTAIKCKSVSGDCLKVIKAHHCSTHSHRYAANTFFPCLLFFLGYFRSIYAGFRKCACWQSTSLLRRVHAHTTLALCASKRVLNFWFSRAVFFLPFLLCLLLPRETGLRAMAFLVETFTRKSVKIIASLQKN